MTHMIHCDVDPSTHPLCIVQEHKKGGNLEWNPANIRLHLSKNQHGKFIDGYRRREEMVNELVLNANVLDYLLNNQDLIPEKWKEDENGNMLYICFWGTIYRICGEISGVRCLVWCRGGWGSSYRWFDEKWYDIHPAAVTR